MILTLRHQSHQRRNRRSLLFLWNKQTADLWLGSAAWRPTALQPVERYEELSLMYTLACMVKVHQDLCCRTSLMTFLPLFFTYILSIALALNLLARQWPVYCTTHWAFNFTGCRYYFQKCIKHIHHSFKIGDLCLFWRPCSACRCINSDLFYTYILYIYT